MKDFRWLLFVVLLGFWIVLSSTFEPISLMVGAMVSFGVAWFTKQFKEPSKLSLKGKFLYGWAYIDFLVTLIIEMIKANIQVAMIVLHPKCPIQPQFIELDIEFKKAHHQVLLANAITLTPGTLSVDVFEGHFLIHALTDEAAASMDIRVNKLILKAKKLEAIV
jgi:multicomponent Na+:H+ antiporter subunit E